VIHSEAGRHCSCRPALNARAEGRILNHLGPGEPEPNSMTGRPGWSIETNVRPPVGFRVDANGGLQPVPDGSNGISGLPLSLSHICARAS
jgi:hypothetical protein